MTSFRSALLGATMLMGAGALSAANAADVYEKGGGGLKDEPGYMPAITWTGFYVGAHAGGSFGDGFDLKGGIFEGQVDIGNSTLVGLHLGYNWQGTSNIVIGVEGDYSFSDSDEEEGFLVTESVASVRARLGYAFGKTMVYATGGVAFLNWSDKINGIFGEGVGFDDSVVGWVAGTGIERKITNNVSLGLEGLYYAFDDNTTFNNGDNRLVESYDRDFWAVRARLNYHFTSGYDEALK